MDEKDTHAKTHTYNFWDVMGLFTNRMGCSGRERERERVIIVDH